MPRLEPAPSLVVTDGLPRSALALLVLAVALACGGEGEGEGEGEATDEDEDGYTTRIDCDDEDDDVHPGAADVCGNDVDEDCSGEDLPCGDCPDDDGDGHADASCGGDDCDDSDGDVHPGLDEACGDGLDQDCVGGDASCAACDEGAVSAGGCACGGITRSSGYCCDSAWQATDCAEVTILWTDTIQTGTSPWGFDGIQVEYPVGNAVPPDNDANGVSFTRVSNPLASGGYAIRQFATFDGGGSRSQAGLWSFANTTFGAQATSAEGIYLAQEWYFPDGIGANGDFAPWLNLWDWHSTDAGGGNRWHTSPGLMLHEDGSMRVRWEWAPMTGNTASNDSTVSMPVGDWFDIEMYYQWTASATTLRLWINGALALEQSGVRTRAGSHQNVEAYVKWYGSDQGGQDWSPTPSERFVRNVRVAATRITR